MPDVESYDDYDYNFLRSMFARQDDSDEEETEYQDIAEYSWSYQGVRLIYHLAFLAPGHGNCLWNASDCIAKHLLFPEHRERLFGADVLKKMHWPPRSALEFGAGAALPSMALLKEGVEHLICTDRKVNQETFEALELSVQKNSDQWGISKSSIEERVHLLPHTWGIDVDKLKIPAGDVDLLIASDCIYDPTHHQSLLESASATISKQSGLLVVGYSFHMNVSPDRVLEFFAVAEEKFDLIPVSELEEHYDGQNGIGNHDPSRGAVYVKVLAYKTSNYFR